MLFLVNAVEVISHYYCFLLENLDNNVVCQIMLELKLLSNKDLIHCAKMYSDYQKNTYLLNKLLVVQTDSVIVHFCHLLQKAKNQQELGYKLVNGKCKFYMHKLLCITIFPYYVIQQ